MITSNERDDRQICRPRDEAAAQQTDASESDDHDGENATSSCSRHGRLEKVVPMEIGSSMTE